MPLVRAMIRVVSVFLLTAVFVTGAARAQQVALPNPVGICGAAKTAAARLICADHDLAAQDTKLVAAYRQSKNRTPPAAQKDLLNEQLNWMRERDRKCGLVGKDTAPIDELRKAKQCMQDEIEARLARLQNAPAASAASSNVAPNAAPSAPSPAIVTTSSITLSTINQRIIITPVVQTSVSATTGETGSSLATFRLSAPASGINGTAICGASSPLPAANHPANASPSAKPVVKITIADDANSYRLFENDTWSPILDELRNAVRSACIKSAANGAAETTSDLYEVNSSRGLFVADSTGVSGAWNVETNLPRTRRKLQSDLGIQKWIEPNELTRNPYFFAGVVVGMVIQLEHKVSDNEAVFARSNAQIFVSGVPHDFAERQMVVLAGRVTGNKGVVDQSGSEELLPAVEYVGTADCAGPCEALSGLAVP